MNIDKLLQIMQRLRAPRGGCPWDLEQTFATIAPYTIEEAYEVADAIARNDHSALCDELGDLLFQVVFHARMAEEAGAFTFGDVVAAICDKMERRHPHVFGDAHVASAAEQTRAWEEQKARERSASDAPGALDDVPLALPALMRAAKLGKRAARVGFDWPDVSGVRAKISEELGELDAELSAGGTLHRQEHEIGDLLFAVVKSRTPSRPGSRGSPAGQQRAVCRPLSRDGAPGRRAWPGASRPRSGGAGRALGRGQKDARSSSVSIQTAGRTVSATFVGSGNRLIPIRAKGAAPCFRDC